MKDRARVRQGREAPRKDAGGAAERHGLAALAAGSAIYVVVVVVASLHPVPSTWGFHLPGFLPAPLRMLLDATLLLGAASVAVAAFSPKWLSSGRQPRTPPRRTRAGMRVAPLLLIPFAGLLWLGRERGYFLGDQMVWLDNLPAGRDPLFSEPLAARIWGGFAALLRALALPVDAPHLAVLPLACGIIAMVLSWGIARKIASGPGDRLVALALIGTLGVSQLYFGHIESYPVASIFLLAYLLIGVRAAGGTDPPVLLPAALSLAIASHLVLLFLYPSYIIVALSKRRPIWKQLALGLAPLLFAAVLIAILGFGVADVLRPFRILQTGIVAGGLSHEARAGSLTQTLAGLANVIGLVMPVPALLLIARVVSARPVPPLGSPGQRFLASAAVVGLLAAIVLILEGTSAQDWDLLAVTLIPLALFGISFAGPACRGPGAMLVRVGLVTIALVSLLGFVLVNAIERSGVRRFGTLMAPSAQLRHHERAFGSEKLVKYYSAHQDYRAMLVYARQAANAEPTIPRYWSNIGTALYGLGRFDEAARFFEEAARRGMRQEQLFYTLGLCYMNLKQPAVAAARFRTANDISGGNPEYLSSVGFAMLASGDTKGARATWRQVLARWPEHEGTRKAYEQFFGPDSAATRDGP